MLQEIEEREKFVKLGDLCRRLRAARSPQTSSIIFSVLESMVAVRFGALQI